MSSSVRDLLYPAGHHLTASFQTIRQQRILVQKFVESVYSVCLKDGIGTQINTCSVSGIEVHRMKYIYPDNLSAVTIGVGYTGLPQLKGSSRHIDIALTGIHELRRADI